MPRISARASGSVLAFGAGAVAALLVYPALDFVQACRTALAQPASLHAAVPPVEPGEVHPAFPGLDRTPGEGVSVGSEDAPVVVYEFSDFQCPFCARWAREIKPLLMRDYVEPGRVRFVYIDFPLPNHANAVPSALAARCAGDEERYWPYHDRLFEQQAQWQALGDPTELFAQYAGQLGLDVGRFRGCMERRVHEPSVRAGFEYARAMGVEGTPWLFVNGVRVGSDPARLQAAIEHALAATSARPTPPPAAPRAPSPARSATPAARR